MNESLDHHEEEAEEGESWLISYADMLTVLMAFFVIIIAASVPDKQRMERLSEVMHAAVEGKSADTKAMPANAIAVLDQTEVLQGLREAVRKAELDGLVSVAMTSRGVEVNASSELLFGSGQAELSARAGGLMDAVATIASPLPCVIGVEGHTDDVPMRSATFPSNWELSAARAASVVRRLQGAGMPPDRLSAVGYAETRPAAKVDPERPEDGRARNRRVVLLITRQTEG